MNNTRFVAVVTESQSAGYQSKVLKQHKESQQE
jgi:hypothetical protein